MSIQSIWIILITSYIHWLWIVNSLTPKSLAHLVYSCVIEMFSLLVNTSTSLPKFILNMLVLREIPLKHWNTTQRADKTKVSPMFWKDRIFRFLFIMHWGEAFLLVCWRLFYIHLAGVLGSQLRTFFSYFRWNAALGSKAEY